jgi:primosomal protein N' (replication factor Y) (superfamily II helicase)
MTEGNFSNPKNLFAQIILPISVPKPYTYKVPIELNDQIQIGTRVEVPLKNRIFAGIVYKIIDDLEIESTTFDKRQIKSIFSIIDHSPIISNTQIELWEWISQYYVCSLGDIMQIAIPATFRLSSETKIIPVYDTVPNQDELNEDEYLILEALTFRNELSIEEIRKLLNKKTVAHITHNLLTRGLIQIREDLVEKYKEKSAKFVKINPQLLEDNIKFNIVLTTLEEKTQRQLETVLALYQLQKQHKTVRLSLLKEIANVDYALIKALDKKRIVEIYSDSISRLSDNIPFNISEPQEATQAQINVINKIKDSFKTNKPVLLHGITGSGKTRIYIEFIKQKIKNGHQVLYLVPEIALTTQLVHRLIEYFGNEVQVFHSKLNQNERTEVWNAVTKGKKLIVGPRSAIFLPFINLDLIIVDEEHDQSFKQQEPAPRYQARDICIYLAKKYGIDLILGSATPSFESFLAAKTDKISLVSINERIGTAKLPIVKNIQLNNFHSKKNPTHFSSELINSISETLEKKQQIIIFQNRRGFAPIFSCTVCGWKCLCDRCDVSLTYHKFSNSLKCHYCSAEKKIVQICPACGSSALDLIGIGTEKIEEELKNYFPDARIARMDFDSVKSKTAHEKLLIKLESGDIDILVGTQMVTKGLDFKKITLVGVVYADQLWSYPDFRSAERAYQTLSQVAGRSGRGEDLGNVLIQTSNAGHPILLEVINHDFEQFYKREIIERQNFNYPPYSKIISIELKDKDQEKVHKVSLRTVEFLSENKEIQVLGPSIPVISRINNQFIRNILIKLPRNNNTIIQIKNTLVDIQSKLIFDKNFRSLTFKIDVDPY